LPLPSLLPPFPPCRAYGNGAPGPGLGPGPVGGGGLAPPPPPLRGRRARSGTLARTRSGRYRIKSCMCAPVSRPWPPRDARSAGERAPRPTGRAPPDPSDGAEEEEQHVNPRGDVVGEHAEGEQAPSPRHRLRDRRTYWGATMRQMGLVCALTLSVITGGFRTGMDWDPDMGPAPPAFLRNHPSALAEAAFVSEAVAAGVAARTMRCSRDALTCILPLGVAFNSAMKRRLIWDGRHVNRHLRKRPCRMETLQR
jgi:hypothetical protein